jgi:hypothetical protein
LQQRCKYTTRMVFLSSAPQIVFVLLTNLHNLKQLLTFAATKFTNNQFLIQFYYKIIDILKKSYEKNNSFSSITSGMPIFCSSTRQS